MTEQVEVLEQIVDSLGETTERPRQQIQALIDILGEQSLLGVLAETDRVEDSGGMLLPDGSRRRTKGGVFFVLARRRLSRRDAKRIFGLANPEAPSDGGEPSSRPEPKPKVVDPPKPLRRPRIVEVEELRGPGRATSPGVGVARAKPNGYRPRGLDDEILTDSSGKPTDSPPNPTRGAIADSLPKPAGTPSGSEGAPTSAPQALRGAPTPPPQPSGGASEPTPAGSKASAEPAPDSSEPSSTRLVKLVRTGRRKIVPPPPPPPMPEPVPAMSNAKAPKKQAQTKPRHGTARARSVAAGAHAQATQTNSAELDAMDRSPETRRAPQASDPRRESKVAGPNRSPRRPTNAAPNTEDLAVGARQVAAQVLGAAMSRLGQSSLGTGRSGMGGRGMGGTATGAAERREQARRSSLTRPVASRTILEGIREEVFAAVADRLGLSRGQIASALYGTDDAVSRRKVGGLFDGLGEKGKEVAVRLALAVMDT